MLNVSGRFVIPEGTYVFAATLRWLGVALLVAFVVRDILHPDLDVVRRTYGDDPDGGVFDGAPDWAFPEAWRRLISAWKDKLVPATTSIALDRGEGSL